MPSAYEIDGGKIRPAVSEDGRAWYGLDARGVYSRRLADGTPLYPTREEAEAERDARAEAARRERDGARSLIIKGDRFEAARAAADRGIPLAFVREIREPGPVLTVGRTSASVDALNAWVCEDRGAAPFPVGSLLYWSEAPLS